MSYLNYGNPYRNHKEHQSKKRRRYKLLFMTVSSLLPFAAILLISRLNLGSYIIFAYLPYVLFLLCPILYFIVLSFIKEDDDSK